MNPRGQAAVESALTLPLVVFCFLGFLQLGALMNARVLAQYAVWKAARAGAIEQGSCRAIVHTALAVLMPAISRVDTSTRLADQFALRKNNAYNPMSDGGHDGQIFEVVRERPLASEIALVPGDGEDLFFDQPVGGDLNTRAEPLRLELRAVFWFRMRIPFANWVISRILQAHYGIQDYAAQNPLMISQTAKWKSDNVQLTRVGDDWPGGPLEDSMSGWAANRQYLLPIRVTATLRMLSAARVDFFANGKACPLGPPWPGY